MKNRYRIVRDNWLGYEVQVKKWWFPFFWFQCTGRYGITNTHQTKDKAENFARAKNDKRLIKETAIYLDFEKGR